MNVKRSIPVLSLSLMLALSPFSTSGASKPIRVVEAYQFHPVRAVSNVSAVSSVSVPVIHEGFGIDEPGLERAQRGWQRTPTAHSIPIPSPVRDIKPSPNQLLSGKASWYCSEQKPICHYAYPPGSMVAAACVKLRAAMGPDWRGKTVTVIADAPIEVQLVDLCRSSDKLIDLYWEPMRQLGGTGVLRVVVKW